MFWGCFVSVLSVYGGFSTNIVFLALLEAFGRAFWGRSGASAQVTTVRNRFLPFLSMVWRVWGGLWECYGVVWVVFGVCMDALAKIVFLALLEAFGRAFWGRSGPSEHWKIDFCRVCRGFVGGLRGVPKPSPNHRQKRQKSISHRGDHRAEAPDRPQKAFPKASNTAKNAISVMKTPNTPTNQPKPPHNTPSTHPKPSTNHLQKR